VRHVAHWICARLALGLLCMAPSSCAGRVDSRDSTAACGLRVAGGAGGNGGRFHRVGLHLLHGLVLAALGRVDEAHEALRAELAFERARHVDARECGATPGTRAARCTCAGPDR